MARQRWWTILGVIGLAALSVLPTHAQSGSVEILGSINTDSFPTVTVELHVSGGDGRSRIGLRRDDLQLSEDGQAVTTADLQELPQPAVGASVGIVFDAAQPLGDYVPAGRAAIEALLAKLTSESVGLFMPAASPSDLIRPLEVPTFVDAASRNTIINYLRTMPLREGETLLYDALEQAIISTAEQAGARGSAAVVVVLSDGKGQGTTEEQVSAIQALAKAQGVRIVAIGFGTAESLGAADTGARLSALALSTDGAYFPVEQASVAQIETIYADEFPLTPVSHYRLTYSSALQRDGQPHALAITLRDGDQALAPAEGSFTAPQDTTRLRPLSIVLGEYLLFAVPIAVLLVVATVAIIETTRRVTSQVRSSPGGGGGDLDHTQTKNSGTRQTKPSQAKNPGTGQKKP